ncbi:MAG: FG-GAP-like repeat-containing protein [Planctomycetota bacterium]
MTIRYTDVAGIDTTSLGQDDLVVTRLWGPVETLVPSSFEIVDEQLLGPSPNQVDVTYTFDPLPRDPSDVNTSGEWDPLDFGEYRVALAAGRVVNENQVAAAATTLGSFDVQTPADGVFFVNSLDDGTAPGAVTLRGATQAIQQSPTATGVIVLGPGVHELSLVGAGENAAATGDLDITGDITIYGDQASASVVDANGIDRVFDVQPGGRLELVRVGVTGGGATDRGGGVRSAGTLVLDSVEVTGNRVTTTDETDPATGAGVALVGGDASIVDTTIRNNVAGVLNNDYGGSLSSYGGGLSVGDAAAVVSRSTIADNSATTAGGVFSYAENDAPQNVLTLTNVTVSGNRAELFGGAGLLLGNDASLDHVTVANNLAGSGDVGLATYDDAINPTGFTVNLANSIIVGPSSAADLQGYANGDWQNNSFATSPGVNPEITSGGYNLFSSVDDALFTSGGPVLTATDTETTADYDDILSPLADYGGPTPTHALPPGSPALDAANPASVVVEDQRGVARTFDADVDGAAVADAGAYEADSATVTGVVFLDLDGEGRRDGNELGIAGRRVFADLDLDGVYDAGEPFTFTVDDDPTTVAESELGRFELAGLAPGNTTLVVESPADWTAIQQAALGVSFRADGELAGSLPVAAEAVASVLDVDDEGRFVAYVTPAAGIDPGDTNGVSDVFVYDRLTGATEWISQSAAGVPAASGGIEVAISGDGAVVAFTSDAALTASAGPGSNLYLYDRGLGQITHTVVGGGAGDLGSLDVNADGMVVAFVSGADLSTGVADTNNADDVFVFDRSANPAGVVELISVSLTGVAADFFSRRPSLSSDGNRVAFDSWADDISATDGFNIDVFVRDRAAGVTTLVSTGNGGGAANGDSTAPSISGDGLWVGYESTATDLTNTPHFFDLPLIYLSPVGGGPGQTVLVTKDPVLGRALADSNGAAEVSGDGRFLLYESTSTQLVPQAGVTSGGLFLYDRVADENRVVLAPDDFALSGVYAKLSGDGATVVLATPEQLAEEDGNVEGDAYARTNPFLLSQPSDFNATLIAGQLVAGVEFGQLPNPGSISGTYFDDLDGDGVQDAGEPGLAGRTVFLDADGDGGLDGVTGLFPGDELRTTTDADGAYQFAGLPANADYSVVAVVPEDEALVLPTQEQGGAWQVFLAAAEAATNRNFATQPAAVGGESNNATIRGVVFADTNGNGLQDAGEPGLPGKTVYLDLNNNGLQDAGVEEQFSVTEATTDATGAFTLSSLGSVGGSVRILNAGPGEITNPRGNAFAAAGVYETALDRTEPLDIYNTELVDLTGDNLPEIVVAKRETNRLTVLVNDGAGGYGGPITIDLGVSLGASSGSPAGAIAVAHGDFNGAGSNDLAVISYYTSDVTILLDYNAATGAFASTTNVTSSLGSSSGRFPFEIVTIDADGDGDLDLATADAGTSTVSLLLNDGNGVFSANPFTQVFSSVLPGAAQQEPAGLAVGDFNGDEHQDLAVANFVSVAGGGIAGGSVAVLLGDGDGGFAAAFSYDSAQELFGSGPTSIVAGAFVGGDETLDLAVSHFASNTVSILRGNGDGSFTPLAPLSVPEGPRDLTAADIDGDDDLDLIVSGATGSVGTEAQPAAEQAVAILRNTASRGGDGLDPAEVPGVADLTFGDRFFSHAVGDVDGNGTLDLVVADGGTSRTYVASSSLINGGYQVSLAGTETIEDLNFAMIAALPGDYNGNGVVDAGDYTHWRDHFGQTTAAALAADGNGDGRVDAIDYTIWRDQFQAATAATAATAVASPAAPARSRAPSSAAAPQPQTAAAESAASGSAPAMAFDQAFAAFAPSPIDPAPPAPPTRRVGPAQPALPGRDRDRLPLFFDVFAEPPSAGGSAPNTRVGFSPEAELSDEAFFRAWSWWDDVAGAALGKLRTPRRS